MKRIYVFLSLIMFGFSTINAQTVDEAALFALDNQAQGTARSMATANAFGALGADAASFTANPAGIGFYRHNEFSFTPQFTNVFTGSEVFNGRVTDNKSKVQIGNIAYVKSLRMPKNRKANFINWGFAYNQRSNFSTRRLINDYNTSSSVVDVYTTQANNSGLTEDDLQFENFDNLPAEYVPIYNAYQAYLINPSITSLNAFSGVVSAGQVQQRELNTNTGRVNEFVLSVSGNTDDFFYWGGTIGLPIYSYSNSTAYTETDTDNVHSQFDYLYQYQKVSVDGAGFYGKAGVIVRPNDWLRLGVSLHSAESVSLLTSQVDSLYTETYDTDGNYIDASTSTNYGNFSYRLRSAPKATFSAAAFINSKGFISLDVDYIDYSNVEYRKSVFGDDTDNSDFFTAINNDLSTTLKPAINVRLGGEYALNQFRFMGGYAFYGSPYEGNTAFSSTNILSAGLGTRLKDFSFDIALQQSFNSYSYRLYNYGGDSPFADVNTSRTRLSTTFGFRF